MGPLETRKRQEPQKPTKAFLRPSNHGGTSHISSTNPLVQWALEEPRQGRSYWTRYAVLDNIGMIRLIGTILPRPTPNPILPHFTTDLSAKRLQQDHREHAKVDSADDLSIFGQSPALRTIKGDGISQTASDMKPKCLQPETVRQSRHSKRKEELMLQIAPIVNESNAESSHIFLCWGRSSRCQIAAVRIPNAADDVTIWQLIRQEWYASRGKWRRYIPFLDVRQIEVVRVSIAGSLRLEKSSPSSAGHFIGMHFSAHLSDEKLRDETTIAEYRPQEFPCGYDPSTGSTLCELGCVSYEGDFIECPERKMYAARRRLLGHGTLGFLPFAFSDPILAKGNALFEGRNLIKSHQ